MQRAAHRSRAAMGVGLREFLLVLPRKRPQASVRNGYAHCRLRRAELHLRRAELHTHTLVWRVLKRNASARSSHAQLRSCVVESRAAHADGIPVFERGCARWFFPNTSFSARRVVEIDKYWSFSSGKSCSNSYSIRSKFSVSSVTKFQFSINQRIRFAYAFQASPREPACSLPCPPARIVPVSSPLSCRAHCHSRCRVSQTE